MKGFILFLIPFFAHAKIVFHNPTCKHDLMDKEVLVECEIQIKLEPKQEHAFLLEEEVEGVADGDYINQMISPLNGHPNLYHSPFPFPIALRNLQDRVMTIIDLNRPFQEGRVLWKIPTHIYNREKELLYSEIIEQEFRLINGVLIIFKDKKELYQLDLNSFL